MRDCPTRHPVLESRHFQGQNSNDSLALILRYDFDVIMIYELWMVTDIAMRRGDQEETYRAWLDPWPPWPRIPASLLSVSSSRSSRVTSYAVHDRYSGWATSVRNSIYSNMCINWSELCIKFYRSSTVLLSPFYKLLSKHKVGHLAQDYQCSGEFPAGRVEILSSLCFDHCLPRAPISFVQDWTRGLLDSMR